MKLCSLVLLLALASGAAAAPVILPLRWQANGTASLRRARSLGERYAQQPLYGSVRDNGHGHTRLPFKKTKKRTSPLTTHKIH